MILCGQWTLSLKERFVFTIHAILTYWSLEDLLEHLEVQLGSHVDGVHDNHRHHHQHEDVIQH